MGNPTFFTCKIPLFCNLFQPQIQAVNVISNLGFVHSTLYTAEHTHTQVKSLHGLNKSIRKFTIWDLAKSSGQKAISILRILSIYSSLFDLFLAYFE